MRDLGKDPFNMLYRSKDGFKVHALTSRSLFALI